MMRLGDVRFLVRFKKLSETLYYCGGSVNYSYPWSRDRNKAYVMDKDAAVRIASLHNGATVARLVKRKPCSQERKTLFELTQFCGKCEQHKPLYGSTLSVGHYPGECHQCAHGLCSPDCHTCAELKAGKMLSSSAPCCGCCRRSG